MWKKPENKGGINGIESLPTVVKFLNSYMDRCTTNIERKPRRVKTINLFWYQSALLVFSSSTQHPWSKNEEWKLRLTYGSKLADDGELA